MAKFTKAIDLQRHQQKRFQAMKSTMIDGHQDMAVQGLADARELTSDPTQMGAARQPFLNRSGNPFGRGKSAALSTPTGLQRGIRPKKSPKIRLPMPALPIGIQSGKLLRSHRLNKTTGGGIQSFDLTQSNPGGGIFRLRAEGTRKMVGNKYHAELKRRWRSRNQAFILYFVRKQRI